MYTIIKRRQVIEWTSNDYWNIGSAMAREDLQEVVNDTFYSLWVNAERIDLDKGSLRAYLAAIARNKAKNKLREHKTQTLLIQETDQVEVTDFCLGLEKEERAKILKDALDMLKRDEREITKLMRARKKLKIHLRERGICQ